MNEDSERGAGVWASVRRIADTLLAVTQNRVELFSVELQEERCRLVEAILCAAAVAACGILSLALITFTLIVALWDNPIPALAGLSTFSLLGTGLAWRALQARLKKRTPFADTIEELKKDRSCLKTDN